MERVLSFLTALVVLTVCSCGMPERHYSEPARHPAALPLEKSVSQRSNSAATEQTETVDRKIIKKGEIEFETTDIGNTKSSIVENVRKLDGYIENDNVVNSSYQLQHKLNIRVPADKFELLLEDISVNVEKFDRRNIDVLDVTEEYIDVQSRVKTKKELQARYMELLKQAANVEDMLNIEREIGKLHTDIESIEGRMRYLNDRIAYSTLAVTFYQKMESEADKFSFSSELKYGIMEGWELFLWFIIGLSYLWVFILFPILVGIVATIIIWMWRRKRKN